MNVVGTVEFHFIISDFGCSILDLLDLPIFLIFDLAVSEGDGFLSPLLWRGLGEAFTPAPLALHHL